MLADPDPEQPVQRGERHLDGPPRRVAAGPFLGRDIAAGKLGHRERPADARPRGPGRGRRPRRSRSTTPSAPAAPRDDRQQRGDRKHGQGAEQQDLPQRRMAPLPATNRRMISSGSRAQDGRVVECAAELEEGQVERDRDHDEQDACESSTVTVGLSWVFRTAPVSATVRLRNRGGRRSSPRRRAGRARTRPAAARPAP